MKNNAFNLTITENSSGQRIDNFLFTTLKGVPKSHIYQILRTGQVRVNKKRIKPSYHLGIGDVVRLPPLSVGNVEKPVTPSPQLLKLLADNIIYEDENLLVINKPYSIASHGGSGINFGVIEILRALKPELTYLDLVHRLDRETSGCLLLAKKRSILTELHEVWRNGQVTKVYLALIKGNLVKSPLVVKTNLAKNQLRAGERFVKVNTEHGKESITEYRTKQKFVEHSLVEVVLYTGRTHQIRVHAAHIGHPIIGDEKYGDKAFNRIMRHQGLDRLCLHAHKLSFFLPSLDRVFDFVARPPEAIVNSFKCLTLH